MAKQPTFKLYRICNRELGKAFQAFSFTGHRPQFTDVGAFFRKPETIRKHLRSLTGIYEWTPTKPGGCMGHYKRTGEKPDEYKKYYVEVYSVLQLSMYTAEAGDYLGKMR